MNGSCIDYSGALAPDELAGAEGFEPSNTGSKVPRLTAWPRPKARTPPTSRPLPATPQDFPSALHRVFRGRPFRSGLKYAVQSVSVYDRLTWRQVSGIRRGSAC